MNVIAQKKPFILCPLCGTKFTPQFANICEACTLKSVDNVKILSVSDQLRYCRFCERFQRPPWVHCHRESQQMMEILLKKVKGLNKVQFVSANFIWTEPHSKRLKLKISLRRQITDKLQMQQTQVVQFVEVYTQCDDCRKNFTPHEWDTNIQVRQMAEHKRTFLMLEQNLMKQKFSSKVLNVQPAEHGVDFFFKSQNDAIKYLDYIKCNLPINLKQSKQLISQNIRDNTSHIKTVYSITIPKVCRDDLLKIPPKLCLQFGNCSPMLLCLKVSKYLYFMDITNFKKVTMSALQYFKYEELMQIFTPKIYAKEFLVLNNQGVRNQETPNVHASWGIVITQGIEEIFVRAHLNLECDNDVLAYDLKESQDMQAKNTPDFVLIKKLKKKEDRQKVESKKKKKSSARQQFKNKKQKKQRQVSKQIQKKVQVEKKNKQVEQKKQEKEQVQVQVQGQDLQNVVQWQDISDDESSSQDATDK